MSHRQSFFAHQYAATQQNPAQNQEQNHTLSSNNRQRVEQRRREAARDKTLYTWSIVVIVIGIILVLLAAIGVGSNSTTNILYGVGSVLWIGGAICTWVLYDRARKRRYEQQRRVFFQQRTEQAPPPPGHGPAVVSRKNAPYPGVQPARYDYPPASATQSTDYSHPQGEASSRPPAGFIPPPAV